MFNNTIAVCQDVTTGRCTINLNVFKTGIKITDFETADNLKFTLTYDADTRTVQSIFNTIDGATSTIFLNSTKFDALGNTTVCSTSLTTSAGTILCVVPQSFGNLTIISELFLNGVRVALATFSIAEDPKDVFGFTGYVFLLILIITLSFVFITSTIGMIIGFILGFLISAMLGIYVGGPMVGMGSTIMWLIIAGGIIIWKINKMGES